MRRIGSRILVGFALATFAATAQQYVISTVAGGAPPPTPIQGIRLSLGTVWGVAADAAGNAYLASSDLNSVFRLDPDGTLTRIAGNSRRGYSGDGGPAISAQLNDPRGVAVDGKGNLFVADYGNARIRKVSPDGLITTVAGNGTCCFSGDGGPATSAQLQTPFGMSVDKAGNLLVADLYGGRVREVSPASVINTVAGDGSEGFSGDGGSAASAQLRGPTAVVADDEGGVFVADYNNRRVRKISTSGIITTVVGNGTCCSWFSGDGGPATNAPLIGPLGLAMDSAHNLFLADYGRVRKVSTSGIITTVAGGGQTWFAAGDRGPASSAAIVPVGVAVDGVGNVFIADGLFSTSIRKVSSDGIIVTIAGNGAYCCFSGDGGPATNAQLNDPASVAVDGNGNLYIADARNGRIREISSDGTIATVANACYSPDDSWLPCSVAVDRVGNLYVADDGGTFKISADGSKTKLTDHGLGLAVDGAGNLFIADQYSNVIRRVSPDGSTTTVVGTGVVGFSGDGGPATTAQLNFPVAVALDQAGNLYIADSGNQRIRMVSTSGVISTLAGASGDLLGGNGGFVGLAVDNSGNVFFEENSPSFRRVRRVSPEGIVTTIAGTGVPGYTGDSGPAANAQLNPGADELGNTLAIDSGGNLYVADSANNAVRILRPVNQ